MPSYIIFWYQYFYFILIVNSYLIYSSRQTKTSPRINLIKSTLGDICLSRNVDFLLFSSIFYLSSMFSERIEVKCYLRSWYYFFSW